MRDFAHTCALQRNRNKSESGSFVRESLSLLFRYQKRHTWFNTDRHLYALLYTLVTKESKGKVETGKNRPKNLGPLLLSPHLRRCLSRSRRGPQILTEKSVIFGEKREGRCKFVDEKGKPRVSRACTCRSILRDGKNEGRGVSRIALSGEAGDVSSGAKFYRDSIAIPNAPVNFLEISYLTCCIFFSPLFYDFRGILSRQVTVRRDENRVGTPEKRRNALAGFTGF